MSLHLIFNIIAGDQEPTLSPPKSFKLQTSSQTFKAVYKHIKYVVKNFSEANSMRAESKTGNSLFAIFQIILMNPEIACGYRFFQCAEGKK